MQAENMAAQAAENLEDLTTCTICLETFTRPKRLPCEHSYCYSCLLLLGKDRSTITCPYCQEEHEIPASGVTGFKNNLLLNNLIGMSLPRMEICSDCKQNPSTDHACEHCQQNLCSPCLVEHTKLALELSLSLNQLKENLQSTPTSHDQKLKFENFKTNLKGQQVEIDKAFRLEAVNKLIEVKILLERAEFMNKLIQIPIQLYEFLNSEDRESESGSYVSELAEKVGECTTVDSLRDFKNNMTDLKTFLRLIQSKDEEFRFRYSTSPQDGSGQVEFGQAVVNVRGKYQTENIVDLITQFVQDSVEILSEHVTPTCPPRADHVVSSPPTRSTADAKTETEERFLEPEAEKKSFDERNKTSTASTNKASNPDQVAIDNLVLVETDPLTSSRPTRVQKYRQNQLPRNVAYIGKGERGVVVLGKGKSVERENKLCRPFGCAYHVERDEIFVADWGNNRIMVYSADGQEARVFYTDVLYPQDVAVSSDGNHVYIATAQSLIKATVDARHVKTIRTFSLGDFRSCYSVICHREFTVVVENAHKSVIVFNDRDEEVRCLEGEYLRYPCSVAVSDDELFYVTDLDTCCVKVFNREGEYIETFPRLDEDGDISGIAVDGDGNVCVSSPGSHCIDVYTARRELMTSISGPGETPGRPRYPIGLCLTPDGGLIVADFLNDRVQIF